eukprot:4057244-Prymnesium_polylepis.1
MAGALPMRLPNMARALPMAGEARGGPRVDDRHRRQEEGVCRRRRDRRAVPQGGEAGACRARSCGPQPIG